MQISNIKKFNAYNTTNVAVKSNQEPKLPIFDDKKQRLLSFAQIQSYAAQKLLNPSFGQSKVTEYPFYNIENYVHKDIVHEELVEPIKNLTCPNGEKPYKKEKDVYKLLDGIRDGQVKKFQISALQQIIKNPLFTKAEDITKLISQINTIERGIFFITQVEKLHKKYPTLTAKEIVEIVPRLTPDKLTQQNTFIREVYVKSKEQKPKSKIDIDIFSELLSSINDPKVAKLQLRFFKELMDFEKTNPSDAISLIMNIEDEEVGNIKSKTIIKLIEKGFKSEDLPILIPKIKSHDVAKLNIKMADYFLKELKMTSDIASKIMCNIPDGSVFNMHKNIIEEMKELREFEGIDTLKTLGDIQTAEMADLKTTVIKELAKIDKFDGHDIMHIVTNVESIFSAEIKLSAAQKLAKIEKLNGHDIGYIIASCHTEESADVKCKAAEELSKIPEMTSEAITLITSRLLKPETAQIQIDAVKELQKYNRFTPKEIARIARGMRNIDFKEAKIKALNHLIKQDKLNNTSIVNILKKINGESKDKYLLSCIDKMLADPNFNEEDIVKIASTLFINKHTCNELIEYFSTIPRHIKNKISDYSMVQDFYPFKDKTYLNKTDRKALINALINHSTQIYDEKENKGILSLYKFLPQNNEDYCTLLPLLAESLEKSAPKIDKVQKEAIQNYDKTIEKIYSNNSNFPSLDFENPNTVLPTLKYKRSYFISEINRILKDLPPQFKDRITDQFGFVITENEKHQPIMLGYPQIPQAYTDITDNPKFKIITKQIENCVMKYTKYNDVIICKDKNINKQFKEIFTAIPELYTLVEKQQNEWHDFDTFTHTLRVIQEVIKNERFKKLDPEDKKLLFTAALLHDLTKKEYDVDKGHALTGAYDAHEIAKRFNFTPLQCSKLFAIIRNHEWLKYYNKEGVSELQKIERAKTVAFSLREGNAFELVSILSEADLKGMKKNNESYNLFEDVQKEGNSEVARYIRDLQRTAIHLPQNKLPKASELVADGDIVREANIGGIKNKVIYLNKNMLKGTLPFDKSLDPNDFNLLVHALESEKNSIIFQRMDEVDNDNLISASYVNLAKGNWKTFRQQGYILDVDSDNIHAAYFKDYGSGLTKNIDQLKLDYLFEGYFKPQRDYISQKIKEKLHISDDNYKELYQKIKNKSLSEIRTKYPFVSTAIKHIYMEMQGGQYTYGRNYNEVLVSRPRIQGVFAYDRSITQVPRYLRKYAQDADIPIIIFLE